MQEVMVIIPKKELHMTSYCTKRENHLHKVCRKYISHCSSHNNMLIWMHYKSQSSWDKRAQNVQLYHSKYLLTFMLHQWKPCWKSLFMIWFRGSFNALTLTLKFISRMSEGNFSSSTVISGGWDQTKTELRVINSSKTVAIIFILCFFFKNNGLCIFMQTRRVQMF